MTPLTSLPIELMAIIFGYIPDTQSRYHFMVASKACNGAEKIYKNALEAEWQSEQEALIDAVAKRSMSTWERIVNGYGFNTDCPEEEDEKYMHAQKAFDIFYNAFNNRCIQPDIGYLCIDYHFLLAVKGLKKIAMVHKVENEDVFKIKFYTTIEKLAQKAIIETAKDFARQPSECITMSSFIEKARQMLRIYSAKDTGKNASLDNCVHVESVLREELLSVHEANFYQLADAYLDPTNSKVAVIRNQIASELKDTTDERVLNERIKAKAKRVSSFYRQLTVNILPFQKWARYYCLHQILGELLIPRGASGGRRGYRGWNGP